MKDIDFDELDRAVASALGTVPPSSVPPQDPQSSTTMSDGSVRGSIEVPSEPSPAVADNSHETSVLRGVASDSARPMVDRSDAVSPLGRRTIMRRRGDSVVSPVQDTTPPVREATPSEPPVATSDPEGAGNEPQPTRAPRKRIIPHRSGRAMDVVANTNTPGLKPKSRVSRLATTVTPVGSVESEAAADVPVVADVFPVPANEMGSPGVENASELDVPAEAANEVPPTDLPSIDEPENTDFGPVSYETDLTTFDETTAKELEQPLSQDAAVSPFISDAKVEKRPLGGLESSTVAPADIETASLDEVGAMRDDVVAPAELARDIVAIESKELEIPEPPKSVRQSPVVSPAKPVRTSASAPAGPAAIPRQYKEVPRVASEDDEAGAIFDPQTYHVAPESPEKRSFGWGWFIAIVSIVLLIAVVAALAWMEGVLPIPL